MATKKLNKTFVVRGALDNFELAKAKSALKLKIFSEDILVGDLEIGRGSLIWWSAHQVKGRRIRWSKFAEMLDQLPYGKEESETSFGAAGGGELGEHRHMSRRVCMDH